MAKNFVLQATEALALSFGMVRAKAGQSVPAGVMIVRDEFGALWLWTIQPGARQKASA